MKRSLTMNKGADYFVGKNNKGQPFLATHLTKKAKPILLIEHQCSDIGCKDGEHFWRAEKESMSMFTKDMLSSGKFKRVRFEEMNPADKKEYVDYLRKNKNPAFFKFTDLSSPNSILRSYKAQPKPNDPNQYVLLRVPADAAQQFKKTIESGIARPLSMTEKKAALQDQSSNLNMTFGSLGKKARFGF